MSAKFSIRLGNNPGLRKGRDWMVLAQIHGPNRNTLPEGRSFASPVFALELRGDELVFIARGGSEEDGETGQRIVGSIPARFGSWQSFSVIAELRDDGRLGIATDENMRPSEEYVLKPFHENNHKEVDLMIQQSVEAMECLLVNGLNQTMNKYNS